MDVESHVICASPNSWRRRRLLNILENAGFQVRTCGTAEELLDLAAHAAPRPDDEPPVLILDAELQATIAPSRIIAALRRGGVPMRAIVLAEADHEGEIIRCLREGADDFLHLPADPSEIVETVCRVSALPNLV